MIIGSDISLNHGAAVRLDRKGNLAEHWFYSTTAGVIARSKGFGSRIELPKTKDTQQMKMARLAWIEHWLDKTVLVPSRAEFIGIEDYALRAEQGAHQLGEVGGIARILFWFRGAKFRLHDPISVKMFAAHDGTAQKDSVEESVRERWGVDFGHYNNPQQPGKRQDRTTSEDLADAFAVAKLVWTEVELRSGRLLMSELHPKEVQVFNRVTKTYPISLLGREWIHNPKGGYGSPDAVKIRLEAAIARTKKKNPKLATYLTRLLTGDK